MLGAAPQAPPTIDIVHPLIHGFWTVWPLWALVALIGALKLLGELGVAAVVRRRYRRARIFEIDQMSGTDFERRLEVHFRDQAYRVERVGKRGDFGADLLLDKDGKRCVVQAKCWRNRKVGVKAVQEVVAARAFYSGDSALVVTNSRFTDQARTLAKANGVRLWDREALVRALLDAQSNKSAVEPRMTVTAAPRPPVASPVGAFCARCGTAVSEKVRDYCVVHRDRFGGLIYCYEDQRGFPR